MFRLQTVSLWQYFMLTYWYRGSGGSCINACGYYHSLPQTFLPLLSRKQCLKCSRFYQRSCSLVADLCCKKHGRFPRFDMLCLSNGDNTADFLSKSLMLEKPLARFISASSARRHSGNGSDACTNVADTLRKGRPYRKAVIALQCLSEESPWCSSSTQICSVETMFLFFIVKSHFRNCLPRPKITVNAWVPFTSEGNHMEQPSVTPW